MTLPILLAVFAIPTISIPFVYFAGKKSPKLAAMFVALIALINIMLVLSTVPEILNSTKHQYLESYTWIPTIINTRFSLFLDGISASISSCLVFPSVAQPGRSGTLATRTPSSSFSIITLYFSIVCIWT